MKFGFQYFSRKWWFVHAFLALWIFTSVICSPARGEFCKHQQTQGRSWFLPFWVQFWNLPAQTVSLLTIYFLVLCGFGDIIMGAVEVARRIGIRSVDSGRRPGDSKVRRTMRNGILTVERNLDIFAAQMGTVRPASPWQVIRWKDQVTAWLDSICPHLLSDFWQAIKLTGMDVYFVVLEPVLMLIVMLGLPAWLSRIGFSAQFDVYKMIVFALLTHIAKWLLLAHKRWIGTTPARPWVNAKAYVQDSDRWVMTMLLVLALPVEWEIVRSSLGTFGHFVNAMRWTRRWSLLSNEISWRQKMSKASASWHTLLPQRLW